MPSSCQLRSLAGGRHRAVGGVRVGREGLRRGVIDQPQPFLTTGITGVADAAVVVAAGGVGRVDGLVVRAVAPGLGVDDSVDVAVAGILANHDAGLGPTVRVGGGHAGDMHRHVEVLVGGNRLVDILALDRAAPEVVALAGDRERAAGESRGTSHRGPADIERRFQWSAGQEQRAGVDHGRTAIG